MKTFSVDDSKLIRVTAVLVIFCFSIATMIIAKSFLVPLAWSLLIALASFQMLNRIERKYRINRLFSSLIFVALMLIGIVLLFYFFFLEITSIIHGIPSFSANLINSIQKLLTALEEYGIHTPVIDKTQIHDWVSGHMELIAKALAAFGKSAGQIFLVAIYLFFILYYRDNYRYFMRLRSKTADDFTTSRERAKEEIGIISNFLYGLFTTTLILAVMLYVIFLFIGLKFAMFFAILFALLTLIPYIGSPVGMAIVFVFALITNDGLLVPLLALAGIIVSNTLRGNVIKPIIIGKKIDLNAFAIFLSVITGGLIWGVSGMILFMPFAGIAKVLLESNESTKPLVALFVTLPKKEKKKSIKSSNEYTKDIK